MSFYLSYGSNLGDRFYNLAQARQRVEDTFGAGIYSPILQTPPVDYFDQPCFLNMVGKYKTPQHSPEETLQAILAIENEMGRKRVTNLPKGPRVIDLDLLLWENVEIKTQSLVLPHPQCRERAYVQYLLGYFFKGGHDA